MVLTVEDGTGLSGANGFLSVAEYKAHSDDRGVAYSQYADSLIEQAIVRSTDHLSVRWPWAGYKLKERGSPAGEQALAFPRSNLTDEKGYSVANNIVPREIKKATAEIVHLELATPGSMSPVYIPSERVKSEKVGPISTEFDLSRTDAASVIPILTVVQDLVAPFLKRGAGNRLSGGKLRG